MKTVRVYLKKTSTVSAKVPDDWEEWKIKERCSDDFLLLCMAGENDEDWEITQISDVPYSDAELLYDASVDKFHFPADED